MSAIAEAAIEIAPGWVTAEMPPGYQNRVAEIQRLVADLEVMGRFGRLLCASGPALAEAVRDVFLTMKMDAHVEEPFSKPAVGIKLDATRRLILYVSAAKQTVQKKSGDMAHAFRLLHEVAEDADRVVVVLNTEPDTPLADRGPVISPDAAAFLRRMGVSAMSAATVFGLWKLSLQDPTRARTHIERLYAQDGGVFELTPAVVK
jgi:hypothetical protein